MALPLQVEKKDRRRKTSPGDSFYGSIDANLLREKHWAYLQRRYHMGPRQLQVAKLTCRGLTNDDIAKELKISPGTVKSHLRSIFHKTRTRSKITMLLRLVDDVNEFFGEYASTTSPRARKA
jgi:DNA-binding NarL/FixJ family response regulator